MSLKTMPDDPWASIAASDVHLLGRRVEGDHALAPFWTVGAHGAPGLAIRGMDEASVPRSLPKPRGIALQVAAGSDEKPALLLLLQSPDDRDVFLALCRDVIASSASDDSVAGATGRVFRRLAHWQSLLSQARPGELGPHQVRGLMGELWLLDRLRQRISMNAALRAWVAPDDHPQDFALGSAIVEVKARLAASRPLVMISSLEQLEPGHLPLFLLVVELSPSDADGARTLNSMATQVMREAAREGIEIEELAALALHRRGYVASPLYDEARYVFSGVQSFAVLDDFPRITRSQTDMRVHDANYSIELTSLVPYGRTLDDVLAHASDN